MNGACCFINMMCLPLLLASARQCTFMIRTPIINFHWTAQSKLEMPQKLSCDEEQSAFIANTGKHWRCHVCTMLLCFLGTKSRRKTRGTSRSRVFPENVWKQWFSASCDRNSICESRNIAILALETSKWCIDMRYCRILGRGCCLESS